MTFLEEEGLVQALEGGSNFFGVWIDLLILETPNELEGLLLPEGREGVSRVLKSE